MSEYNRPQLQNKVGVIIVLDSNLLILYIKIDDHCLFGELQFLLLMIIFKYITLSNL